MLVYAMLFGMLFLYAAIPGILACIVLRRIPPQFRRQKPTLALLLLLPLVSVVLPFFVDPTDADLIALLVPLFPAVWAFFVHPRVAKSIQACFDAQGPHSNGDCGGSLALGSCICYACSMIPLLGMFASPAGLVLLALFYVKAFNLTAGLSAKMLAVGAGESMRHEKAIPSTGIPPVIVPRKWSTAALVISIIFGLGVLAWPLLSFFVIFTFDAPIRDRTDELRRYTLLFLTWFYPLPYGVAWLFYQLSRKWRINEALSLAVWILPAIVPAYWVWFASTWH